MQGCIIFVGREEKLNKLRICMSNKVANGAYSWCENPGLGCSGAVAAVTLNLSE